MNRVRLICWNLIEAKKRAETLKSAGYVVDAGIPSGAASVREMGKSRILAIVIDLSRLPSQGRDIAIMFRSMKATRRIPLVFVEGDPEKVARIRNLLPDAVYSRWGGIRSALQRVISTPPLNPVVLKSVFEAYSGVPLTKKLGIKPGIFLAVLNAPEGFEDKLSPLPIRVRLTHRLSKQADLTIWFNRSRRRFELHVAKVAAAIGESKLWIVWPKKEGRFRSNLTQQIVRETGLAAGLVDYKICSIDDTWSGLLFTHRKLSKPE